MVMRRGSRLKYGAGKSIREIFAFDRRSKTISREESIPEEENDSKRRKKNPAIIYERFSNLINERMK